MKKSKNLYSIDGLLKIMDELRVKCPWDKEQTMNSLKILTIEETFELVDAINDNDYDEIKNELIEYNSNENNSINCEIAEDIIDINNSINNLPNKYSIPIIVLK